MASKSENAKGGEAGHHGRDRQPAKDHIQKIKAEAPDEAEAATPREVKQRSDSAGTKRIHDCQDHLRPGRQKETPAS